MRLEPYRKPSSAAVTLVGFPTDVNSSFLRGAAKAPPAIREALTSEANNPFTESGLDLAFAGVLADAGDVSMSETAADFDTITSRVSDLVGEGTSVLSLGGDHSITYPIVRGFAQRWPDLSIVHIDAHPDLYPTFEGNRYSHACPFARILEDTSVTKLVQIGIRTMSDKQRAIAERFNVRVFAPSQLADARASLPEGPVYVSLDLDGLDPAFAPGVSHREPGGLSVREVLDIVRRIPGRVVGADVVELNPHEDFRGNTAMVAAKFVREFVDRMYRDRIKPGD
jgi:arginase